MNNSVEAGRTLAAMEELMEGLKCAQAVPARANRAPQRRAAGGGGAPRREPDLQLPAQSARRVHPG